jgi:hypothetical protein
MFIQESKHLDIILKKEEKSQPKKCNLFKIILLFLSLLILFTIIFVYIIILKKEIKNCKSLIKEKSDGNEKNFDTIFAKLKEMEDKNNEDIATIKKENKELKDLMALKNYLIESQYNVINELMLRNNNTEQKNESEYKDLKESIKTIYYEILNNDTKTKEEIISYEESGNDLENLIRKIIIDIQDEDLKKVIIRQSVELEVQYKYLIELISQKESMIQNEEKNIKELISQNDKEIEELNKSLKLMIQNGYTSIQTGEWFVEFFAYNEYRHMQDGRGERSVTKHINFDVPFKKTPKVMVSITLLDTEQSTNLRLNVYAEHVNSSGFDLRIATWDNTRLYRTRASWISFIYTY